MILMCMTGTDEVTGTSDLAIQKSTINNSGGISTNQRFSLQSSLAQSDASQMTSSRYAIKGGYWQGNGDLIFANEFE